MRTMKYIQAALLGVALVATQPMSMTQASAETVRVLRKGTATQLRVPMNRAVVIESDIPFANVSIANPAIADINAMSERTAYVLGKAPGITTLTMLDAAGQLIASVDVRVAPDVTEFKERLRQIMPDEKIEVRTANDGIVLSGTVSSIGRLERALELAERYAPERVSNLMSVGGVNQVMLKVRFAEMQRTAAKSLGSSLALKGSGLSNNLGISGGSGQGVNSGSQGNMLSGTLPASTDASGNMLLGFDLGAIEVGLMIEAMENNGMARMLAEPNLTALSGQEARFLAGGEYPVPVRQALGGVTVDYKPFGVELNFVPRVLDDGVINLEMSAAVSAIDNANGISVDGLAVSAFSRRETSTTVEMRDGESFAIAGLLQDDFSDSASQLPWIGDVPVLGALFRSASYRRKQSELVILVTPHLVTPTRGEALALPTDRVRPPSERELFMYGRTAGGGAPMARRSTPAGEVARQDFSGSYGYVMD